MDWLKMLPINSWKVAYPLVDGLILLDTVDNRSDDVSYCEEVNSQWQHQSPITVLDLTHR